MDKITVAHYKETPIAWAPDEIVKCINKYSKKYNAVLVSPNESAMAPEDQSTTSDLVPVVTKAELANYDLVHFHNKFIPTAKPKLMQYHSIPAFTHTNFPGPKAVIAQFHALLLEYKNCMLVRNIVDINDDLFVKNSPSRNPGEIRIGFSPSTVLPKGDRSVASKGYYETVDILNKLRNMHPRVSVDVIRDVHLRDCMARKSYCNILIDECVTSSYHRCALEALALGSVSICSLSQEISKLFQKVSGSPTVPFENVFIEKLLDRLVELVRSGADTINVKGKKNKEWMRQYWNPETIVNEFENIYDGILGSQAPAVVFPARKVEAVKVISTPIENNPLARTFVINLDHMTDRWSRVQKSLQAAGITAYTRFSGVTTNNGATERDRENGCTASHRAIVNMAKREGWDCVAIFEDDAQVTSQIQKYMTQITTFLKNHYWHVFYLGGNHNPALLSPSDTPGILQTKGTHCTSSYIIHKNCYDLFLKSTAALDMSVDDALVARVQSEGHTYCINPPLVYQQAGFSYIRNGFRQYDELKSIKSMEIKMDKASVNMESILSGAELVDVIIPSCRKLTDPGITDMLADLEKNRKTYGKIIFTGEDFCAAHNRNMGLEKSTARYIIMLDDDIRKFTPGWDALLIRPLVEDPEIMITSARFTDANGNFTPVMAEVEDYAIPLTRTKNDLTPSACMAFERTDIKFDYAYVGSGFEDTDFCMQMKKKFPRRKTVRVNSCVLVHLHEAKKQHINFTKNQSYFATKWKIPTQQLGSFL